MEQPKHIDMQTPDGAQLNLEALYKLFPSCFTEAEDVFGNLRHVVDWSKLRALLGEYVEDGEPEKYDFTWVGKRAAQHEAATPCRKTLRPCPEESVDWDKTQNLYIEGDNLEVLKLLQNSYMGKVKMIYIDPPYNTGNDFVYHDDFHRTQEEDDEAAGVINEDGERMVKNTASNGRFHSDWCSMIYSRLLLSRNLLRIDGVVFISIDDNEVESLRIICNEVFGEVNLVAQIPWQSRASIQNDTDLSVNHEYILIYAKNRRLENRRLKESNSKEWHKKDSFVCRPLPLDKDKFDNPDNDPRGLWKADPFDAPNIRPNLTYPIVNPNTGVQHFPPIGRHWRTDKSQFSSALADGRILFGKDGNGRPQLKVFYEEKKEYGSIDNSWFSAEKVGTTTNGTKQVMALFDGEKYFDMPKPTSLLAKLLYLANLDDGDIILDFFSGSGTTAHSVLQFNVDDKKNCQYIMVQVQEQTSEESAAYKAGYKNICEIGKERIRRAGKKIKEESPLTTQDLDIGFRVLKCESSNYKDVAFAPKDYSQESLDMFLDNIKEERSGLDLLFDCMMRWGLELSLPYTEQKVDGCTIYNVDEGNLVACFDGTVTESVIDAIADTHPLRVVFRDSSFNEAAQKMNLFELFKQKCSWSDQEVQNNVRVI